MGSLVERWFGRRNVGLFGRWLFTFIIVLLLPLMLALVLAPQRIGEVFRFGLPVAILLCWLCWLGRKR